MNVNQQQKRLLLVIVGGIILLGGLVYMVIFSEKKVKSHHQQLPAYQIQTPGSTVHSNEVWMQKVDQETQLQRQKIQVLEQALEKQVIGDKPPVQSDEVTALRQEVEALKQERYTQRMGHVPEGEEGATGSRGQSSLLVKHTLRLQQTSYRIDQRVPAGAYVKAVLMSAVDASVGVNVSSDPQPVLMRLLAEGTLPNDTVSRLKRCVITGSARGDISSERVFIRLEKMSCVNPRTHTLIETDVGGYVVGEDGKNGIVGIVVDRSGRVISGAILSGILSGASSMMQAWVSNRGSLGAVPRPDLGIQNTVMGGEFMRGGAQSMGNAFDKLADYYIKRAEQLQPVVQINAGRVVHVVFSQGATLGAQQSPLKKQEESEA